MQLKKGVDLIEEKIGEGPALERGQNYQFAFRIALSRGDIVRRPDKCLSYRVDGQQRVDDEGYFMHNARISRDGLIAGVFYALEGMRIGGYRKVKIAPHLAYGERGIEDVIPPNALITVEIKAVGKA